MAQEGAMGGKKVWDSVQLYAVRCDNCFKWRLIPTKEKYEKIREGMGEKIFFCDTAREWRPDMCWAMDRPKIPRTPRGWQRILRIRAQGGTKFADVYYIAPSNRRFRSMVELTKYIHDHPEYYRGVSLSQFSFQSPVPLDENYIAKRPAHSSTQVVSRPNIPRTPRGWQRILRIRAQGGTKFADVYYVAPSNKRFRSMIELTKYINDHPEYYRGVSLSQFSFQSPVPLDENYITKRPAHSSTRLVPSSEGESCDQTHHNISDVAEAAACGSLAPSHEC